MTRRKVMQGDCLLGERDRPRRTGRTFSFGATRLIELEVLLRHRGIESAPHDHLAIVAHHVMHEHDEPGAPTAVAAARRHLLVVARHLAPDQIDKIVAAAAASLRKWPAPALGNALALSAEERKNLGITTFRYAGQTREDQREAKRARDRIAAENRRRARGAVDRRTYLKTVISTAELAGIHGVSERTIRRWKATGTMPETGDVRGPSSPNPCKGVLGCAEGRTPPIQTLTAPAPDRAAGPQPVRPLPFSSGSVHEVVLRISVISENARWVASRVNDALQPAFASARRAVGGRS